MGLYPDITGSGGRSVLPERLQRNLLLVEKELLYGRINRECVAEIFALMADLPLAVSATADREIRYRAGLWHNVYQGTSLLTALFGSPENRLMRRGGGLEYFFLSFGDGRIREAALNAVAGPAPSVFFLGLVAIRLNDWVPHVRGAAVACLKRLAAVSDAAMVAQATTYFIEARRFWGRATDEAGVLDELLVRDDVRAIMLEDILTRTAGRPNGILIDLLRNGYMDADLSRLMQEAKHPSVRAVAGRTLLAGEAVWPVGWTYRWIDRSFNRAQMTTEYGRRPVIGATPVEVVLETLANDKAATVRKIAMQAIIDAPDLWPRRQALIAQLATDKSAAIRAGMSYVLRQQAKEKR